MASHALLHAELIGLLRQHSPFLDQRHLVVLARMVTGLLLSQTVCFDRWKSVLPLGNCLAASWQRRCQRWLCNARIDVEALYRPLILWALQHWQKPGQSLHLALDTTMLWNRCCVVVLSVVAHGRAIPLLWHTLEHPSASVSAGISIALLDKADRLLAGFGAITLLAERAFPWDELLRWFDGKSRWQFVMRLRGDTEIHSTAAPMGCQGRRLRLHRAIAVGFATCSSGAMAVRKPTCCLPIRPVCLWMSPGIWSATLIPRWIWSGATACATNPSASISCRSLSHERLGWDVSVNQRRSMPARSTASNWPRPFAWCKSRGPNALIRG